MKKFIILFLLLSGVARAQDCLRELGGGACIVMENDKYGIKKKGKYIVPTYFDQISDHSGKFFSVEQGGKWGIFNIKGQIVLPVAYEKVTAINADAGLMSATGNGYTNNLVITENIKLPKDGMKANPFLLLGEGEVTVAQYMSFMQNIKKNPIKDFTYEMSWPDTNKMAENTKKIFNKMMATQNSDCTEAYMAIDPKLNIALDLSCAVGKDKSWSVFLTMPMTGVSYKQAQRYCVWLSEKLNQYYTEDLPYDMLVRLPRAMEWEEMALGGLDESMKSRFCVDSVNAKGCVLFNYKCNQQLCSNIDEKEKKYGTSLVPVISYNPDFHGVYCLFGNVSEMTLEEGVSKGGNYLQPASRSGTNFQQKYKGPEPWLGFRWVVEYRIKK